MGIREYLIRIILLKKDCTIFEPESKLACRGGVYVNEESPGSIERHAS